MDATDTAVYASMVSEAAAAAREKLWLRRSSSGSSPPAVVETALVLGSGLGGFLSELTDVQEVGYDAIPHAPQPTVKGHAGRLVVGRLRGTDRWLLCVAGRSHSYEGLHMFQLNFMVRVVRALGCRRFIATNAAGGFQEGMWPGCLMVIRDHVNFYRRNPLHDTHEETHPLVCPQLPNMDTLYSTDLAVVAHQVAKEMDFRLFDGTYATMPGPSYETHSEVREFGALGIRAFGMSTINETMVAAALGMEVFAMSLITNLAAGLTNEVLSHGDVTAVASESGPLFVRFIHRLIEHLPPCTTEHDLPASLSVSDNAAVSSPTVLPQPLPAPATSAEVAEAVQQVKVALGLEQAETCVVLSAGHEFAEALSDEAVQGALVLGDIIHWPHVSASARNNARFVSTGSGRISILGVAESGFVPEEACFLAEVLAALGVRSLVMTLLAVPSDIEAGPGDPVAVIRDALDWTSVHAVPVGRVRTLSLSTDPVTPASLSFVGAAPFVGSPKLASALPTAVYMHFPGPTTPTRAERGIALQLGSEVAGRTSIALAYAAHSCSISVRGVVETTVAFAASNAESVRGRIREAVHQLAIAATSAAEESTPIKNQGSEFGSYQLSYQLPQPVAQGDFDAIAVTAAKLVASSSAAASINGNVVVLADAAYAGILAGTVSGDLVPGAPIPLSLLPTNRGFVVMSPLAEALRGVPTSHMSYPVHLAKALGAAAIVVIGPYVSCSAHANDELHEIMVCKDLVGMSGRNPLTGLNEDRWGERFPDVSNVFTKVLRSAFLAKGDPSLCETEGVVAHLTGPLFGSPAVSSAASKISVDGMVTGVGPEMIVANHVRLPALALCIREPLASSIRRRQVLEGLSSMLAERRQSLLSALQQ